MSRRSTRSTENDEDRQTRQRAAAEERTRKSYAGAGLNYDARTAAGRRAIEVQNLGPTKRASVLSYGKLFRNPADRTDARVRACRHFDDLCHRAYSGLYPEPRFEPRVDNNCVWKGRGNNRVDGIAEMQRLVQRIGDEAHSLLVHRVFWRMQFTAMASEGQGDERALAVMFLSAADAVARFYGLLPPSRSVAAMNARLDRGDLPNRAV